MRNFWAITAFVTIILWGALLLCCIHQDWGMRAYIVIFCVGVFWHLNVLPPLRRAEMRRNARADKGMNDFPRVFRG